MSNIFRSFNGILTKIDILAYSVMSCLFMSPKMGVAIGNFKVHFHGDSLDSLHKFIPKEILPTEYGGDYPNFDPVELGSAELKEFLPKYLQLIRTS
ncbi:hypothetical protein AVEN_186855-1 [Araneus ventricosus]|uniref:CRAL-TRIO domain-containing protein n=1 Tax=Araneus ventricosus TaxID=182803 RepID=A0A4Y2IJ55_ARAVE|nr:hypothetical protein AVEN_186855-1 [Araneus ventricosus]